MASTAVSTVALPVRTMIAGAPESSFSFFMSDRPSTPGMTTSRRITSKTLSRSVLRASPPSRATSTAYPLRAKFFVQEPSEGLFVVDDKDVDHNLTPGT